MQSLSEIRFAKKQQNYLPTSQPTPTERYYFYSRAVRNAPPNSLFGFTYDGKAPVKCLAQHFHGRDKVGQVNRWQLPDLLHADLLGSAQAYRALVPQTDLNASERTRTDVGLFSPRNIYGSCKIHRKKQLLDGDIDMKRSLPEIQVDKSGKLISFLNGPPVPVQRDSTDISHPMQYIVGPTSVSSSAYGNLQSEQRNRSGSKRRQGDKHAAYFLQRAQQMYAAQATPDVILEALGCTWHLHQNVLHHSTLLHQQMMMALAEEAAANGDSSKENGVQVLTPLMLKIIMPNDPILTQEGMSVALGNLYLADKGVTCPSRLLASVLATASLIEFPALRDFCERCMISTLSASNVVLYLSVASRHKAANLTSAAFNWLALNFVTKMSTDSHLRFIDSNLLEQLLKSDRLFVPTEFALFCALMSWCFVKLNPRVDHLPPPGAILSYFSSLPRETALLDRPEGHAFIAAFDAIRYHGITSPEEIYEVQQANILPAGKLVRLLSEQLTSFCEGGDMRSATDLNRHGVRRGFILTDRPKNPISEPIALYGFHFTLVATSSNVEAAENNEGVTGESSPSSISFYIQRRHPQDPAFGAERAEREVFSLRGERYILYSINVFNLNSDGTLRSSTTGPLRGKFLIRGTTSRVVRFVPTALPVFVQFSIVLPSS